ncbi:MAG: hypothetical protein KF847_00010 [Pirellulales bacterium]|nr:hypothetical protein [Pirellulales bacterium]
MISLTVKLLGRAALVAWLAGVAGEARAEQRGSQPTPVDPKPALAELERAVEALEPWRAAVEAGAPIDEADLARLKVAAQKLYANFGPLVERRSRDRTAQLQREHQVRLSQREQAQAWIDAMRAIGPEASQRRAETIAELRTALQGDDAPRQMAALETLAQSGDVEYDKAGFRPLVLPFIERGTDGPLLTSACYALLNTDRRPEDLSLVQSIWERRTPLVDNSMSHLLFSFGDGKIAGRSEEIVLELLASSDAGVRRETLRGLWGAEVSDKMAARIIALADDPESRHDAIYFGLSTLKPKNEAVVDKLVETLADRDPNDWGRALWGLGFGLPESLQPKAAAALADMYAARSDPRTRKQCRDLIVRYAGEEAAAKLPK